jgi:uncharacterized protein YehS (DUF1456 family)
MKEKIKIKSGLTSDHEEISVAWWYRKKNDAGDQILCEKTSKRCIEGLVTGKYRGVG